jgi:hypothetical protein
MSQDPLANVIDALSTAKLKLATRFFLDQDDSGHWYIIPAERRGEWERFMEIPSDDEASWKVPEWAKPTGCGPNYIEFSDPKEMN